MTSRSWTWGGGGPATPGAAWSGRPRGNAAPTAAFIHKTLFIWVAVMAVPLLGERLGLIQVAALATLLVGQLLVAPPTGVTWGGGETMILAATLLWSVEVVLAKRLLGGVSSAVLGAARMGLPRDL